MARDEQRRVLHADGDSYNADTLNLLRLSSGELRIIQPDDLLETLPGYDPDTLFVGLGTTVDRSVLDLAPGLSCVVTPTTSHNHLGVADMAEKGVRIMSLQGRPDLLRDITATAEHTWALILYLTRRLCEAGALLDGGSWSRSGLMGMELRGRMLGIVGLGRIGSAVADVALAFGMEVQYSDIVDKAEAAQLGLRRVPLPDLFSTSDVVSIHAPLGAAPAGMISRSLLDRMRQDTVFVNAAQGELVDEEALADAVAAGRISAAVDVLRGDSRWTKVPAGHRLLDLARQTDRLVVTPHIGGYSDRSVRLVRHRLVEDYIEWTRREENGFAGVPAGF